MELKVRRKAFADAVAKVSSVIPSKHTKEVLTMIRIQAEDGHMRITGNNGEQMVETTLELEPGEQVEDGTILVLAAKLSAILRECTGETVHIHENPKAGTITVTVGKSKFSLPSANPNEYSVIECQTDEAGFTINSRILDRQVRRVAYAAEKGEAGYKWQIQGVRLEVTAQQLTLIATDTRRLAIDSADIDNEGKPGMYTVPSSAVRYFASLDDGDLTVKASASALSVSDGTTSVVTQLLNGRFPPHQDIIPKANQAVATAVVKTADLAHAIRQAVIMLDVETPACNFQFGETIRLTSSAVTGQCELECPAQYTGDPMTLRVNPQYVMDTLKAMTSTGVEEVTIDLLPNNRPMLFRSGEHKVTIVPLSQ